jgi:hypothetical protein
MGHHTDDIQPAGEGQWKVRAERMQGTYTAAGEALVRADGASHSALAGARAWLALSQGREVAGDTAGAIDAARAGLAELGERYFERSKPVIDDTRMHVDLAEEHLEQGQPAEAARRLRRALEMRLAMYTSVHADTLAE